MAGASPSPSSFGRPTRRRDRPHLHLRRGGAAGGIRRVAWPGRAVIAAANVDDRLAVLRKRQVRQFLPVVCRVVRQPSRRRTRSFSDVDVADAALVERPRDRRSAGDAIRLSGVGRLSTCSTVNGDGAGVWARPITPAAPAKIVDEVRTRATLRASHRARIIRRPLPKLSCKCQADSKDEKRAAESRRRGRQLGDSGR